jgi:hypothetical protein
VVLKKNSLLLEANVVRTILSLFLFFTASYNCFGIVTPIMVKEFTSIRTLVKIISHGLDEEVEERFN